MPRRNVEGRSAAAYASVTGCGALGVAVAGRNEGVLRLCGRLWLDLGYHGPLRGLRLHVNDRPSNSGDDRDHGHDSR